MGRMAEATDPVGTETQVYRIFIKANPGAIWDAITKPEFTERYFYGSRVETTGEVGGPFRYHSPDGASLWGDESVVDADRPRRLVVTWRSLFDPGAASEPASRVTWAIDDQGDGTCLLTAVHDGLERSPLTAAGVAGAGWMRVLSGMKTVLETGEPLVEPRAD